MWRWLWLCLLPLIGSAEYVERAVAPAEARSYSLPDASGCYAVTVTGACGAETLESAPSNRVCRTAPISLNWSQQMLCEDGSGLAGIERFTIYEWMEGGPPPPLLQPGPGSLASDWQFTAAPVEPPGHRVGVVNRTTFSLPFNTGPHLLTIPQVGVGNSLLVIISSPPDRAPTTITDNGGGTPVYTLDLDTHPEGGSNPPTYVWRRNGITTEPTQISFTTPLQAIGYVNVIEYDNLAGGGPVDNQIGTRNFSVDGSVTLTTALENAVGIGIGYAGTGRVITSPTTGYNAGVPSVTFGSRMFDNPDLGAAGSKTFQTTFDSAQWHQTRLLTYETTSGAVEGSVAQAAAGGDVAGSVARLPVSHAQAASAGIDLSDTVRRALAASQAGAADDAVSSRVRALRSTSQGAAGESAQVSVLRAVETIAAGGSSADNALASLRSLVSAEQAGAGAAAADALLSLQVELAQGAAGGDAATGDILGSLEVNTSSGAAGGDVSATLATFAVSIHQTAAGAESGAAAARLLLGLEHAAAAGLSVDVSADVVRSISEGAAGAASQDREVFGQRVSVVQAAAGSDGMSAAQRAVAAAIQSAIGDGIAYAIQAGLLNIEQGAAAGFSATAVLESDRFVLVGEVRIDSQSPVIRVVSIRSISGTNDA